VRYEYAAKDSFRASVEYSDLNVAFICHNGSLSYHFDIINLLDSISINTSGSEPCFQHSFSYLKSYSINIYKLVL